MNNYGKHIYVVAQLLNKFDPENYSVEHFLDESSKDLQNLDVTEQTFILNVLGGCIQYKSLLEIVVDGFYARDGKRCLKAEHSLYVVICYVASFQLEELGLHNIYTIIKSLDVAKVCKFLRFFFDDLNLSTWIKDEWSRIYDSTYVKENWIDSLLRWQPEVKQMVDHLLDKTARPFVPVKTSKVTEPKAFNLIKPKPRPIPVPQKIPIQGKSHPLPQTTYKEPKEKQQLELVKQKNRQKAEELLMEANNDQFKCANAEKSKSTKLMIDQILKEKEKSLSFRTPKARPIPALKVDNIPVRLNATTILREDALYQRKVDEELQRIENLIEGARDSSEFLEWKRKMEEKDLEQQLAKIEYRRLEGKISHEEALLSRQKIIEENRMKASLMREETAELMRQYAEKRLQEDKEMRDLVEQVAEGHRNAKQARIMLQKYKQKIAQEVTEENRELLRQALEEAEEELRKKFELICEIRAIESVPFIRQKFVDLTQVSGHGLLCEMSVVELKERLTLLEEAKRKEEEDKRDQILSEKQAKEQYLLDKLEQISLHRAALGKAALLKQEENKMKTEYTKTSLAKNEHIAELQKKLEEKTQERKKQAEILKLTSDKYAMRFWSTRNKAQERQWKELEDSRDRQVQLVHHGIVPEMTAQKMATYQAERNEVFSSPSYVLQA
ncbi:cilia- and flagella-associated protein 99 isoform X1 [Microcaecilia unicolor]|uniref:Cilia- and flagella-associated protein 99 isoform X1 n=1 Tax=Microcaecilia unicolor TaxID=1415580 RepID=A0A6P7X3D6_9AMPH|nr:cilia- and flagella-associated protein 99 isoform X1 [Microcaecilia unicolor]